MEEGWSVTTEARVVAVSVSEDTGTRKTNVSECLLVEGRGLDGDAHALGGRRQVSLLAVESIDRMRLTGLDVWPGDFAENITTEGIELPALPVGTRLKLGEEVLLEVTQIGKVCHERCDIYYAAGDCVMPREGIFASIIDGGTVKVGDSITVQGAG